MLNISRVRRKGGVCEFDLSPTRIEFVGSILSEDEVKNLDLALLLGALFVTTVEDNGDASTTFKEFSNNLCYWFNLLNSYNEILALVFLISSKIL